ncbi:rhodanese-like domain-containing protein [Blochmannia endosymbiont of Colobopsis nipponica]|uniref:rhodanese-like domain-containing protein n=1 Tax=Blochmannia endosymbiont of Colobopsis nipponica TaxID=2681987 RepID=UPI00178223F5|nr:rhodanese-like domain-containing protein [Blochmannia endosymbiont of Colobopsis nipponica]QOI10867.1 rhodanese-like domain-containing protein [Blochmannia endosymbiont of Colobopsis nipponica]
MVNHILLSMIWIALLVFVFFSFFQSWLFSSFMVSCDKAIQLINREDAIVIDLRSSDDYRKGHIIRSVNLSALDIQSDYYRTVIRKKNIPLLLVCDNDKISFNLARYLNKRIGLKNVYVLQNGISRWLHEQLPLVKGE